VTWRQAAGVVGYVGATIAAHDWLALVVMTVPVVVICATVVVLVLATEKGKRADAIKSLAPVLGALASRTASRPNKGGPFDGANGGAGSSE
jgi:hypothetical protein